MNVEGDEGGCFGSALGCKFQPLRGNDHFQIEQSSLKYLVDYNEIEIPSLCDLFSGILHAQLNTVGCVFASAVNASTQLIQAGR